MSEPKAVQHAVTLNQGSLDSIKELPIGAVTTPVPPGTGDIISVPPPVSVPAPAAAVPVKPAPAQPAAAVAAPAAVAGNRYFYNSTEAPIMVPEWNMVLPSKALSAPIAASISVPESLGKHINHGVNVMYDTPNFELGSTTSGVVTPTTKVAASEHPVTSAPNVVTANSKIVAEYDRLTVVAPVVSSKADHLEALKDEDGNVSSTVRDAVMNTNVTISDDDGPANAEVEEDEATLIVKQHRKQMFASELPVKDHIAQQATALSNKLSQAAPGVKRDAVPAPAPTSDQVLAEWLAKPIVMKKVAVFKSHDTSFLQAVLAHEKDTNVLACVKTRLTELSETRK